MLARQSAVTVRIAPEPQQWQTNLPPHYCGRENVGCTRGGWKYIKVHYTVAQLYGCIR